MHKSSDEQVRMLFVPWNYVLWASAASFLAGGLCYHFYLLLSAT